METKQYIVKAQQGTELFAVNTTAKRAPIPSPIVPTKPISTISDEQKKQILSMASMYNTYSKLKPGSTFIPAQQLYETRVQAAMDKYNNKQTTNYFTPEEKANDEKLRADGVDPSYCLYGACKVLGDAGNTFDEEGHVSNGYWGNQQAAPLFEKDGFIKNTNPNGFKKGDLLQYLSGNKDKVAVAGHAMLFHSYVKDPATGKVVGMRTFQNGGDGVEKYVDYLDDAKYAQVGTYKSDTRYSDLLKALNPTNLEEGAIGLNVFTKQFDNTNQPTNRAGYKTALLKGMGFNGTEAIEDSTIREYLTKQLSKLPEDQRVRLNKRGGTIKWLK